MPLAHQLSHNVTQKLCRIDDYMFILERNCFLAALVFYTRVPAPQSFRYDEKYQRQSAKYFPLIGALVGSACAIVYFVSAWLLPASVAVILSMACAVLITGALHEDGFADVCDGFGGGWNTEQVLHIMKDSRIGSYGAIGIVLLLGLKFAVLFEIQAHSVTLLLGSIVAAHTLSRFFALCQMQAQRYVRADGQGKSLLATQLKLSVSEWVYIGMFPAVTLLLLPAAQLSGALMTSTVIAVAWAYYCRRRIGGYTGDCLGAMQQLSEAAFYLGILASCNFT
jgi:adenosylcobinamide-GDP ribazoletransferase